MPTPFTERVASNIRAELARRQLSQADLATALRTTQQTISRRMTGAVPFDTDELEVIAEFLGVPVDALIPTTIGGAA